MIPLTLKCDEINLDVSVRMLTVPARDDYIRQEDMIFKVLFVVHHYDKQYGNYHVTVHMERLKLRLLRSTAMQFDPDQVIAAIERDDHTGICGECGGEQDGCEPDARKYECDDCGAKAVYGAEECLLML